MAQKNTMFSIGLEGGVSPRAKNVMDSGYVNPPQKRNQVLGLNLLWEYRKFKEVPIELAFGIRSAVYFKNDGWIFDFDPATDLPRTGKKFTGGNAFNSFYTLKNSLQLFGKYIIGERKGNKLYFYYAPELGIYWPLTDNRMLSKYYNVYNGNNYIVYEGWEDYYGGVEAKSRVELRFENTIGLSYKFKISQKNQMAVDLNFHKGSKPILRTDLTFYPTLPQFTAKIHYVQNNDYLTLGVRYYFTKEKKAGH